MRLVLALALAAALGGCSTANTTNLDEFITTMSHTNCHVTINAAASVGAMNPGSGVQFQAQADCPNGTNPATNPVPPPAAP